MEDYAHDLNWAQPYLYSYLDKAGLVVRQECRRRAVASVCDPFRARQDSP